MTQTTPEQIDYLSRRAVLRGLSFQELQRLDSCSLPILSSDATRVLEIVRAEAGGIFYREVLLLWPLFISGERDFEPFLRRFVEYKLRQFVAHARLLLILASDFQVYRHWVRSTLQTLFGEHAVPHRVTTFPWEDPAFRTTILRCYQLTGSGSELKQMLQYSLRYHFDHPNHANLVSELQPVLDVLDNSSSFEWNRAIEMLQKAMEAETPSLLAEAVRYFRPKERCALISGSCYDFNAGATPLDRQNLDEGYPQDDEPIPSPIPASRQRSRRGRTPDEKYNRAVAGIVAPFGNRWQRCGEEICEALLAGKILLPQSKREKYKDWAEFLAFDKNGFIKALDHCVRWCERNPSQTNN